MEKSLAVFILLLFAFATSPAAQKPTTYLNPKYDLDIRVSPGTGRLEATGTLRLPASDSSRAEYRLSLSEVMQNLTIEVIEPTASAGIAGIQRADASGGGKWILRPVRAIPAGQTALLRFSYGGGGRIANQFYIGSEVSFASAWGTNWYPLVDGENDKGVGTLRFSVPAGQTVYATGKRRSSVKETEQGVFEFEVDHPTYFAFAAGTYTVVRRHASVPVSAYLLKPRQHMEQYLDGVSKIIDVLTQEFGDYPFDEFAIVEIPRDLAQKASFNAAAMQGFVLVNSRAFDAPEVKYVLNFFGHEFSHQWFPHRVALNTPPGLYMEEALAEYGALCVVEALAGAEAAERYRRTGFEYDPGYSALQYFRLAGAGVDNKLSDLRPGLEHRNLAYSKGFLVFDMLSREVGRKSFRRVLRDLTRRYAFKEIGWNEFLRAVEKSAKRNLRWFYDQWFGRTGAPNFELSWQQEKGGIRGVIVQIAPYYEATLQIEARNNEGQTSVFKVRVNGAKKAFSFPVNFRVESVILDPHYFVLHWTPEYRSLVK